MDLSPVNKNALYLIQSFIILLSFSVLFSFSEISSTLPTHSSRILPIELNLASSSNSFLPLGVPSHSLLTTGDKIIVKFSKNLRGKFKNILFLEFRGT